MPDPEHYRPPEGFRLIPIKGPQTTQLEPDHELVLLGAVTSESGSEQVHAMHRLYTRAEECFPLNGKRIRPKVAIVDKAGIESFRLANEYLLGEGVNPEELDLIFNEFGNWKYTDSDGGDIYEHSSDEVNSMLKKLFLPIENIVDRALDGISPLGYNKHGRDHTDATTRQAIVLNDYLGQPDEVKRDSVIAARAHDLGCLLTRKGHSFASLSMLKEILPSVLNDQESFDAISKAILFHDSDTLKWVTQRWGSLPSEERIQKLADYLGPVGLTTLIADKVDVGIGRVSNKIWAGNIIDDPHAVVNLLGGHDRIEPENETFHWRLKYDPDYTAQQMDMFKHFMHGWQRRRSRGEFEVTFDDWRKMFWGIYTERTLTLANAVFAYLPFIQNVEVQMFDGQNGNLLGSESIRRDNLDRDETRLSEQQDRFIAEGVLEYR